MMVSVFLSFLIIIGVSLYQLSLYQVSERAYESDFIRLRNELNELRAEAFELEEQRKRNEHINGIREITNNQQAERILQQVQQHELEIEELARKSGILENDLETLNRTREEITNALRGLPFLPGITSLPSTDPIVFEVEVSSDDVKSLNNRLDSASDAANSELEAYLSLASAVEELKPVLYNYPSMWPVRGRVSSGYGLRQRPLGGGGSEHHAGLDIAVPMYTGVFATGGGIVTRANYSGAYGYLVIIDHGGGMETYYAHNSELLVTAGQRVERGQVIARAGSTGLSTGPHVHYEVHINGRAVDPKNFVTLSGE
jgi:murein DD-endopeptidase MepM/ murein hydrolase activator NlpD